MGKFHLKFEGYWVETKTSGIPDQSGVYCVYVCSYDENENTVDLKRLIYIGESGSVRKRITEHEKWSAWRLFRNTGQLLCFNFAPVTDGRNQAEAACIYEHQPPGNTEYKDNFSFDSTTVTTSGNNRLLKEQFTVNSTLTELFLY